MRATFFVLGNSLCNVLTPGCSATDERLKANERILRRIAQEGHQIGIHGFDHRIWTLLPQENLKMQLSVTKDRIKEITGVTPTVVRAPEG